MIDFGKISPESPVIAWWSGGADSAVACKLALDWLKPANVMIVFIGTDNEHDDTYRFKRDCEKWYGKPIHTIKNKKWENIEEVWEHYLSLNVATGAICSTELKRVVRQDFQMRTKFSYQVFGFDADEINRAKAMTKNYPDSSPIYPLIYNLLKKGEALKVLLKNNIEPPLSYRMGYNNNNCLKTGCVKGGIGYWKKIQNDFPDIFDAMAAREHKYTNIKGEPVTICKDQSKNGGLVFLKPHPDYPGMKNLSMMKGRQPEALMECNGFCGTKNNEHAKWVCEKPFYSHNVGDILSNEEYAKLTTYYQEHYKMYTT